jgi:hypothetical protein
MKLRSYRNIYLRLGSFHGAVMIGPDFLPCYLLITRRNPGFLKVYIDWTRSW